MNCTHANGSDSIEEFHGLDAGLPLDDSHLPLTWNKGEETIGSEKRVALPGFHKPPAVGF